MRAAARTASADAAGAEPIEAVPVSGLVPADLLQGDEAIILLARPSPHFIVLSSLASLSAIAIVSLLMAYVARWQPTVGWSDTHAFVLGIAIAMLRLGWQALEWYGRVYILTDRRVVRRQGVLRPSVLEIPLREIENAPVFATVRERMFRLGTVAFAVRGSGAFEMMWVMVRRPLDVQRVVLDALNRYGRHGPR